MFSALLDEEISRLEANSLFQAAELVLYLERVRKSKDKTEALTEEKLVELLKKGENEEIVQILSSESAALSTGTEKGTTSCIFALRG